MPSKRIISILLLIIIGSFFAYYIFLHLTQASVQTSSIEILPKQVTDDVEIIIADQQTSKAQLKTEDSNAETTESNAIKKLKPNGHVEVSGTIRNQSGQALAGVFIYSNGEFPPTFSDKNGQYRFDFNPSGFSELLMNVSLSGYQKQKNHITKDKFEQSKSHHLDITLEKALDKKTTTVLAGKVIDRNGQGVANQQIHLITLGDYTEHEIRFFNFARTDQNGDFKIRDVGINTNYQLVVLAGNGYDKSEVNGIWASKETPPIEVILEDIKLTTISAQVVDRDGVPLPNLALTAISLSNGEKSKKYNTELVTDTAGVFVLENFPEGTVNFNIKSPLEVEITGVNVSEMNAETIILPVNIGSHFVSGIVRDSKGETIEGVTITLQSTYSKNGLNSHSVRPLKSDSKGAFAFKNFGPDRHYISIFAEGYKKKSIVHEPHLSDTHLDILLEKP